MPDQASPGGVEGVEPDWPGGSSNVGEVINPGFEEPAPYSTEDLDPNTPRIDVVPRFFCETDGQAFATEEELNVHKRTHRPH